jgi:hypothetical protein
MKRMLVQYLVGSVATVALSILALEVMQRRLAAKVYHYKI